jgi:hypothetical protein
MNVTNVYHVLYYQFYVHRNSKVGYTVSTKMLKPHIGAITEYLRFNNLI